MTERWRIAFIAFVLFMAFGYLGIVEAQEEAVSKTEVITQHRYTDQQSNTTAPYLMYPPASDTPYAKRSLLIFLYGAGGSIENYNLKREPYAQLREQLAQRGYYVIVPELGKFHFMNAQAKATLDGIVAQVLQEERIPVNRVHVMGTSMGAGSSLAYTLHRPEMIRSVCAVMPMTDMKDWVIENPGYADRLAKVYGGTYDQVPEAYDRNSAIKHVAVFEHIPVMLVHGTSDRTVLYTQSKRLADLLEANEFAYTLCTAEGQGHKDEAMREYQLIAADFFDAATAVTAKGAGLSKP